MVGMFERHVTGPILIADSEARKEPSPRHVAAVYADHAGDGMDGDVVTDSAIIAMKIPAELMKAAIAWSEKTFGSALTPDEFDQLMFPHRIDGEIVPPKTAHAQLIENFEQEADRIRRNSPALRK